MPELTITSPHLMSTPESNPTYLPYASLCQSRPYPYAIVDFIPPVRDSVFGLRSLTENGNNKFDVSCNSLFLILCGLRPRVFFTYFLMVERYSYIDICTSYVLVPPVLHTPIFNRTQGTVIVLLWFA
jgi:hypothetical protein